VVVGPLGTDLIEPDRRQPQYMTMKTTLIPVLLTLAALTVQAAEDKVLTDCRPPQQLAGATRAFTAAPLSAA